MVKKLYKIIVLGGTHSGWAPNSTPIQRAHFLTKVGDLFCFNVDTNIEDSLSNKVRHYRLKNWNVSFIVRIVKQWIGTDTTNLLVWCGPSWSHLAIGQKVAKRINAKLVLDLYDHLYLPNYVYRARGNHFMALVHDIKAILGKRHLKACNLLVRAIAIDPNSCGVPENLQIEVMNGVNQDVIKRGENWFSHEWRKKEITCLYLGVLDRERTSVLEPLLKLASKTNRAWNFELVGPSEESYAMALREAVKGSSVSLNIYGRLEWDKAMDFVENADCCLYPFRSSRELDCVYPIKLGEYLAFGKPCISSDLQGAREMSSGQGVLFVDFNNASQWYKSIEILRKNPAFCRHQGKLARNRALEITWDKVHRPLWEALINNVNESKK